MQGTLKLLEYLKPLIKEKRECSAVLNFLPLDSPTYPFFFQTSVDCKDLRFMRGELREREVESIV